MERWNEGGEINASLSVAAVSQDLKAADQVVLS
jgi:hypothetical protein